MLANDIIGFHTHAYGINFLRCCDELLEDVDVDYVNARGHLPGHTTLARAYPLGIDAERLGAGVRLAGGSQRPRREVLERAPANT